MPKINSIFVGVASKYRHNEHIVEYELCHRNIVDEKLIQESRPTTFLSKELPSNDRLSNPISVDSSEPLSHDFLPSESNLNTAINHDSDGFSDSGEFDSITCWLTSWDFKTSIKMTTG